MEPIKILRPVAAALVALAWTGGATAQQSELMRFDTRPHHAASGEHVGGAAADMAAELGVAWGHEADTQLADELGTSLLAPRFSTIVRAPGVNLIRVHFDAFDLDHLSEIHIMSLADGAWQRFTHDSLVEWDGWSAIFNGDTVLVELLVAPEEAVSFAIDQVAVNDPVVELGDGGIATLCGGDNRVASSDSRVGRLSGATCGSGGGCGGCTAWLTSVGSAMTAGHCGTAQGGLIEFNVPQSSSSGMAVASNPNDQYPVGTNWYAYQDGGVGFDWAIMNVGANSNTGLRAHWVQGYFHLAPFIPSDGGTLRITGCGVDNTPTGSAPGTCCAWNDGDCTHFGCNANSLTVQTSTGAKTDDTTNALYYAVDTEPANSGSPVIYESNGFAVAVHTNGGCTSSGGENKGTRLTQGVVDEYLNIFLGDNTRFLDPVSISAFQFGTALYPTRTLLDGISVTPSGGTLAIAGGSYPNNSENVGVFTKAVTLRAVSGNAVIGN